MSTMLPTELAAAIVSSDSEPEFAEAAKFPTEAMPKSAEIRLSFFNENTTSTSTDAGVKEAQGLSKTPGIVFFCQCPGSSPQVLPRALLAY